MFIGLASCPRATAQRLGGGSDGSWLGASRRAGEPAGRVAGVQSLIRVNANPPRHGFG